MDDTMSRGAFVHPYLRLLDEIVGEPSHAGSGTSVLDPDTGWAQTLADVDATRASTPLVPGGATIAGHTGHTAYYIELLEQRARGERPQSDWPGSFEPGQVDEESWRAQRERLTAALRRFRDMAERQAMASPEHVGGALGVLVHTAYHLAAIRQMLRVV